MLVRRAPRCLRSVRQRWTCLMLVVRSAVLQPVQQQRCRYVYWHVQLHACVTLGLSVEFDVRHTLLDPVAPAIGHVIANGLA